VDLKTTISLYHQNKATTLDIAIALTAEFGMGDPVDNQRARDIIEMHCSK